MTPIEQVLSGSRQWCVIHADNSDVLPTIPDKSITHIITDPPYEAEAHRKGRMVRGIVDGRHVVADLDFAKMDEGARVFCASEFCRITGGWMLVFCQFEGIHPWREAVSRFGARWIRAQVWVKPDACCQFTGDRPGSGAEAISTFWNRTGRSRWNGGGQKGVYTHYIGAFGTKNPHPTTKPIALMLELVKLFTDPGDIVLDPFCGSGTTGVACIRLGRRFIGVEKDAKYAAVAQERLEAEAQGLNLRDARAGQLPMFGGAK